MEKETETIKENLGKKIKYFRKKKSYSQADLAEIVNIEVKSLSRIESGYNYPQYENLVAISQALGVEPWQLYFSEKSKDPLKMKLEIIEAMDYDEEKIPKLYQYLKMID